MSKNVNFPPFWNLDKKASSVRFAITVAVLLCCVASAATIIDGVVDILVIAIHQIIQKFKKMEL